MGRRWDGIRRGPLRRRALELLEALTVRLAGLGEPVPDADLGQPMAIEQTVVLQMEHPSFSCWVACFLSRQRSWLVLIPAQAGISKP